MAPVSIRNVVLAFKDRIQTERDKTEFKALCDMYTVVRASAADWAPWAGARRRAWPELGAGGQFLWPGPALELARGRGMRMRFNRKARVPAPGPCGALDLPSTVCAASAGQEQAS
jgi:hypothetical protein